MRWEEVELALRECVPELGACGARPLMRIRVWSELLDSGRRRVDVLDTEDDAVVAETLETTDETVDRSTEQVSGEALR